MRGKFISLEGGEGSGKTTAIHFIRQWLDDHKIPYIMTREPGGTPLAEEIRQLVLTPRDESVNDVTELLLVFAARAQHLAEKIQPALDKGTWVISDRFLDSSYVYQGKARGGDIAMLDQLANWVVGDNKPDATLVLDVPVELGQERVVQRQHQDRLDKESFAFHQKVRDGFLERAEADPKRVKIVDASQSLESVKSQIEEQLAKLNEAWAGDC
ncbi:MAG: dTMP kinase [Gammaproteobacteria bacterium]|jgi:dTMP kinase|uniref:Thymidylate kinase n=1 Tax=Marinomonas polaris DSM 16579 TaxID=1122206 RepID=A0A1M4ZH34_9GAMM|nr:MULTISPECIES: dTMP kinase [Marinomonas]MBU1294249.1 dTMP kinase [Gammaproteobacteria bacterium]MBU1465451.1 dTMP kinase [Gammaproteobacteria bacterium]MBU2024953.1 dTMP kinase [Gammaproteobacteria bacterium]MBU2238000.1 dTMP kinase [Gammaproteobacteria bacterium]MBU2317269.1 dTMP kinase [Gammaproteobacteria bacterium]